MMKTIVFTKQFKRDIKRMIRSGKEYGKVEIIISHLAQGLILEDKHRDHFLTGDWRDVKECHIEPDWLLIYSLDNERLLLIRTGTHSQLF